MDIKLPTFFITGAMLRNGKFVDMNNNEVEFDLTNQKIDVIDAAPIFIEHGGKPVGYLTRIYTTPDDPTVIRYDGFVFDKGICEYLSNPGVSAELRINNQNNIIITGMAITKYPAVSGAKIDGVIAMSLNERQQKICDYIKANLDEECPQDLLEKIAVIISKYITEQNYPDPTKLTKSDIMSKELEAKLSSIQSQLEAKLKENEELKAALSAKESVEVELSNKEKELEAKLSEAEAKIQEYESKIKEIKLSGTKAELLAKIKNIEPEFKEDIILSKPLEEQVSFLETYYELAAAKGKTATKDDIQLSSPKNPVEERYRKLFNL